MTATAGNPLSAINLSRSMCSSLSKLSEPQLKNPYDAVALLSHACMLAVDFRLIGLGEDDRLDDTADGRKTLPENWNATTSYNYAFRFAHTQSALQYLVKISRLGGKAVINGLGIGDDKVHTVDFVIKDYFSESSFPFTLPSSSSSDNDDDSEQKARSLQHLFISPGRLADLATLFKLQIIQKLAPALQKEGYEESAHAASQREIPSTSSPQDPLREDRLRRPPPASSPFAQPDATIYDPITGLPPPPPSRPYPAGDFPPPGFEDEYEINQPLGRGGLGGGRRPLNIGERDLYPPGLGPYDPLGSGGGGFIGGGGMHPTFDDPIFSGARRGGQGTGGYDGRIPPGARYDPIGPGDDGLGGGLGATGGGPQFPGRGGGGGLGGFDGLGLGGAPGSGVGGGRAGGGSGGGFGGIPRPGQPPPNPFSGYGGGDFI